MADSFAAGLVGIVLDDRYRLDALIGEGGMGAVYRATHLAMDRRVAVKLLKPHLVSDATQLQRFAREARSTLKVDSPHAVKVLDFGVTPQRDYYMVLEYLDGRTVQRELDVDGPFAPARAVHVARQALHALGAAHRRGLVHRDIKPDNLLLMRVGADPDYTKVLDFGVAKLMEGAARSAQSRLALTQAGMVFGTPEFMSPEQACGHTLDARSDLYSLAATLFAMLTGRALFEGKSAIEWLTHHARTPPPHLAAAQPGLAHLTELDALLQRCLAKQRDRRPRDAEELDLLLAAVSTTLGRAPGMAPLAGAGLGATPSSYLEALPPETVDPGETLLPPAPLPVTPPPELTSQERPARVAGAPPELTSQERPARVPGAPSELTSPARVEGPAPVLTPSTGSARAVPARGRGVLLAAIAIVGVAMIGVAIGLAVTRRPARGAAPEPARPSTPAPREVAARIVDAAAPPLDAAHAPPIDAAAPTPPPIDAGAPTPPRPAPPLDAAAPPPPRPAPPPPSRRAIVDAHLRAAEAALRRGQRIEYLHASELAYQADPTDPRARLGFADALLRTGNVELGCKHLRALAGVAEAASRARAAGCPTD